MSERITADRRLYLVEDRSRVVVEDDLDARWLYCVPGQPIPRAEAERYGLLDGSPKGDSEGDGGTKQARPVANKARGRAADK
ncbi:hypothetical protein [Streptosporangium saharense]|uniref:hypothetical protein n=1 Tax=Streptosporangium saharense TaxID=1706840 RepID=UPI00343AB2EF